VNRADPGRRVALVARPGAARDCVRGALLEIGTQIVVEADPVTDDPDAIRRAEPQVVMVVLDAATEDALDRFDLLLGDPGVEVMFEEAEVALAREGWEAARWRRHLSAKLHHRIDVLPPGAAVAEVPVVDALSMQLEELIAGDEGDSPAASAADLVGSASAGNGFSMFDPVAAEAGNGDEYVLGVNGFEPGSPGFDELPTVSGPDFTASDFGPLLAELDTQLPDPDLAAGGSQWRDGAAATFDEPVASSRSSVADVRPAPGGFGELSLADDDARIAPESPGGGGRFAHDIDDLERRIAAMELVGESPAQPGGAVLVIAGIGGPDAVRQFLGGLPPDFPRAVLVWQRLDGARHNKLVAQMQRATSLPVALARAGAAVVAGTVYIVGDGIGLDAGAPLRFDDSGAARLLDALPAGDSAVILLSGSDAADVPRIAELGKRGAFLGAQEADGCYDATAPLALASQGATSASPSELARRLAGRWAA
jgi:chemosensory pili system protein ChpB (putative protein-glutamate methylesterase)